MSNIPKESGYYWARRVDVSPAWEPVQLVRDGKSFEILFLGEEQDEGLTDYFRGKYEKFSEWVPLSPPE